ALRGRCARGEPTHACCLSAKRPTDAASARRRRSPRDACAATRLIAAVRYENRILSESQSSGLLGIKANEPSDQDGVRYNCPRLLPVVAELYVAGLRPGAEISEARRFPGFGLPISRGRSTARG